MNNKNVWHSVDEIQEALLGNEMILASADVVDFEDVVNMITQDDYSVFLPLMLDVIRFGKNSKKIEEFSDYMIEECRVFAESIKEEV